MSVFRNTPIEKVRSYWDARPCNIRHSALPVGSYEYFREVDKRKTLVEPHIKEFADYDHWIGHNVLEVGCGIGTDTIRFARARAKVTAVDLSSESLQLARKRAQVYGVDVEFINSNAEDLSVLGNREFHLVYSFGVIHHTPNPEAAVQEMRKHVHPFGECRVMVYHRRSWKAWKIVKGRFWKFDQLVASSSEAASGCPVTYSYTRKQIRELFERNGFRVTKVSVDHIFPYRVEDYVNYRYEKTLPIRLVPEPIFRWLERRLGWHLMVVAVPC